MLVTFLAVLLAGNTGLVWWMIKLNKDMHVSDVPPSASTESSIALMSNDNHKLATGMALTDLDLPTLVADGNVEELDHLTKIRYTDARNTTRSSSVHSYHLLSANEATFFLFDGALAHVEVGGVIVLDPPHMMAPGSGVADDTGVKVGDICSESMCASNCIGFLSKITADTNVLHSVKCNGQLIWNFPSQFGTDRRKLSVGNWWVKKIKTNGNLFARGN